MAVEQSDVQAAEADRQWIFPSLNFTCTTTITGWTFIDTSGVVVCPIIQLWSPATFTPSQTDYREFFSPSNYSEPISLSQYVHSCSLHTPLMVSAGTVVGFITRSVSEDMTESHVQLISRGTLDGFSRDILAKATFIDTAQHEPYSSGFTPLIAPTITGK